MTLKFMKSTLQLLTYSHLSADDHSLITSAAQQLSWSSWGYSLKCVDKLHILSEETHSYCIRVQLEEACGEMPFQLVIKLRRQLPSLSHHWFVFSQGHVLAADTLRRVELKRKCNKIKYIIEIPLSVIQQERVIKNCTDLDRTYVISHTYCVRDELGVNRLAQGHISGSGESASGSLPPSRSGI